MSFYVKNSILAKTADQSLWLLTGALISANKLHLYTDAARSLGFGAIFENEWFYGSWNELVKDYTIAY